MARSIYATLQDFRDAGIAEADVDDERARILLETAADLIDVITDQTFGPVRKTFVADGRGGTRAGDPQSNRLLEVFSVAVRDPGVAGEDLQAVTALTTNEYVVLDRAIKLRPIDTASSTFDRAFVAASERRFPYDWRNVQVDAVVGWLDTKAKYSTTAGTALAAGAVTISLVATDSVEVGDALLVNNAFWVVVEKIITASTITTAGTVQIDAAPKAAPINSVVVSYGRTPRLIRMAAVRTAVAQRFAPGSDEESDVYRRGRIRSERTDNYNVTFADATSSAQTTVGAISTGDTLADSWLAHYRAHRVSVALV